MAATRTCELPTLPSKTLETLAKGRVYATGPVDDYPPGDRWGRARGGGEVLTFKGKLRERSRRVGRWLNGGYAPRRDAERADGVVVEVIEMGGAPEVNGTALNRGSHFNQYR